MKSANKILSQLKDFLSELGNISEFTLRIFRSSFRGKSELKAIFEQAYHIGIGSMGLISLTGFIMGVVLTIQIQPTLITFGAEAWLPGIVSISIIKEIGPVVTGLICAGKIGSGFGAEIGSMKVTEQIDAMEVSATNPMKYLVFSRVIASAIIIPLLVVYSDLLALLGTFIAINLEGHISIRLFTINAFELLYLRDIFSAFTKTIFFGLAIGIIGAYKGYTTTMGTEGVGKASNSAVIWGSLAIFLIDIFAVQIENILW